VNVDIVIPTSGRPSLSRVLAALAGAPSVVLVDDRPRPDGPLAGAGGVRVVRGPARGPAAARNAGWRTGSAPWVAFLDDDVEPGDDWLAALHADLAAAEDDVDGVQGRIVVPLPADRRPTDWERATQGLERARWATADIAYRRSALERVGGFDERFPRAYRAASGIPCGRRRRPSRSPSRPGTPTTC
jgi:GT2 family glycosyltransferase